MDYVHEAYVGPLTPRPELVERRRGLTELVLTLRKRDGLDAIVLAGTDFATLFDERNTDFPSVDCAALHLQAIVKGALV